MQKSLSFYHQVVSSAMGVGFNYVRINAIVEANNFYTVIMKTCELVWKMLARVFKFGCPGIHAYLTGVKKKKIKKLSCKQE